MDFSMDKAKGLLEKGMAEAQGLMKNASKVDDLLIQMEFHQVCDRQGAF